MRANTFLGLAAAVSGVAIVAAAFSAPASAATATANLGVSATVTNNCTISTAALAFGSYDPVVTHASTNLDGTGTVVVACTKGVAPTVGLGLGIERVRQHPSHDRWLEQLFDLRDVFGRRPDDRVGRLRRRALCARCRGLQNCAEFHRLRSCPEQSGCGRWQLQRYGCRDRELLTEAGTRCGRYVLCELRNFNREIGPSTSF